MIVVSEWALTRRRPLLGALPVFATKAEAEATAKHFNCQGAHKMGNQWMPCASHGEATGRTSSPSPH